MLVRASNLFGTGIWWFLFGPVMFLSSKNQKVLFRAWNLKFSRFLLSGFQFCELTINLYVNSSLFKITDLNTGGIWHVLCRNLYGVPPVLTSYILFCLFPLTDIFKPWFGWSSDSGCQYPVPNLPVPVFSWKVNKKKRKIDSQKSWKAIPSAKIGKRMRRFWRKIVW